jgi:hypothetical protein
LDKFQNDFSEYLKHSLGDTNADVRKKSKYVFIKFNSLYPQLGEEIIHSVDYTYQKAIYDEFTLIGLDPELMFDASLAESTELNIRPQINSGVPSFDMTEGSEINFDNVVKSKELMAGSTLGSSMVLVSSNGSSIQG